MQVVWAYGMELDIGIYERYKGLIYQILLAKMWKNCLWIF